MLICIFVYGISKTISALSNLKHCFFKCLCIKIYRYSDLILKVCFDMYLTNLLTFFPIQYYGPNCFFNLPQSGLRSHRSHFEKHSLVSNEHHGHHFTAYSSLKLQFQYQLLNDSLQNIFFSSNHSLSSITQHLISGFPTKCKTTFRVFGNFVSSDRS